MNSHIYNLQERTECNKVEPKLTLWVLKYHITGTARGVAVVKAKTVNEAQNILYSDSNFNCFKNDKTLFVIEDCQEIHTEYMSDGLAMEEWIKYPTN